MTIHDFTVGSKVFAVVSGSSDIIECHVVSIGTKYVTAMQADTTLGYREFYLRNSEDKFLTGKTVEGVPFAKLFFTEEEAIDSLLTSDIKTRLAQASPTQKLAVLDILRRNGE